MDTHRKFRCMTQKIYLIETLPILNENERSYVIMGSTGNVYNVMIKNEPICNCPDFLTRHNRCKHIYFVLIRIMNVHDEDKIIYTNNDLIEMFSNIPNITKNLIVDQNTKNMYNNLKSTNQNNKINKKNTDDVCPICLDDLENGEELDYCKYSCGKQVHKLCFKMWSTHKEPLCVFCRKNWVQLETNYINIKINQ